MYLHSILSNVLAVFGVSLLFVLWHSNVLELSVLFPVILRKDVFLSIILSLPLYFRYQVKTGGGAASSFTTHPTLFMEPSIICNGLWSGCREIVLTGTVKCVIYIEKEKSQSIKPLCHWIHTSHGCCTYFWSRQVTYTSFSSQYIYIYNILVLDNTKH